jgi:hypothetical protein
MSRGAPAWKSSDVAWRGGKRPYDLVKEMIISFLIVAFLAFALAILFASPDPKPVTLQQWATQSPKDFLGTTLREVTYQSLTAQYGPPYQPASQQSGSTQSIGPISPETWFGAYFPVDTYQDFVAGPLSQIPGNPAVAAMQQWDSASASQQKAWATAYAAALGQAPDTFANTIYAVPEGNYGPLADIMSNQYKLAQSGGLDNSLRQNRDPAVWFNDDYSYQELYLGDSGNGGQGNAVKFARAADASCVNPGQSIAPGQGCWYYNQAVTNTAPNYAGYLAGDTWGIDNEVGNWPGAWWLWFYTMWYQFGPGANGSAGDLVATGMAALLGLLFLAVPWIPGVRSIPKLSRVYRLMWKDYYDLVNEEKAALAHDDAGRRA